MKKYSQQSCKVKSNKTSSLSLPIPSNASCMIYASFKKLFIYFCIIRELFFIFFGKKKSQNKVYQFILFFFQRIKRSKTKKTESDTSWAGGGEAKTYSNI